MYSATKKYFNEALEKIAQESAQMLTSLAKIDKDNFLNDVSTKQLKRILLVSADLGDVESCIIIKDIIKARGYHNEL